MITKVINYKRLPVKVDLVLEKLNLQKNKTEKAVQSYAIRKSYLMLSNADILLSSNIIKTEIPTLSFGLKVFPIAAIATAVVKKPKLLSKKDR